MTSSHSALAGALFALAALPLSVFADHALPEGYAATTQESACAIMADLGLGSRDASVACLQQHLIEDGHLALSSPTGYFGELTKAAVVEWQREKGIAPTGYFGALSRAAFGAHETAAVTPAPMPHAELDVSAWPAAPTVAIVVTKDAMSGYNLEIQTQNFTFAPQRASSTALPNEGHAHLMVDGKKFARVYGNWFHIPAEAVAAPGIHEIHVTLNANDHSDLVHDGKVIEARYQLTK